MKLVTATAHSPFSTHAHALQSLSDQGFSIAAVLDVIIIIIIIIIMPTRKQEDCMDRNGRTSAVGRRSTLGYYSHRVYR